MASRRACAGAEHPPRLSEHASRTPRCLSALRSGSSWEPWLSEHPGWNKLTLTLTHSADRLISNDTTLAHRIQRWSATITTRRAWLDRDIDRGGQASAAGAARPKELRRTG
jgi:hypothetical protein